MLRRAPRHSHCNPRADKRAKLQENGESISDKQVQTSAGLEVICQLMQLGIIDNATLHVPTVTASRNKALASQFSCVWFKFCRHVILVECEVARECSTDRHSWRHCPHCGGGESLPRGADCFIFYLHWHFIVTGRRINDVPYSSTPVACACSCEAPVCFACYESN